METQDNRGSIEFHRIREWFRLEWASGGLLVQPSCSVWATQSNLPRNMSRWLLKVSKEVDSTISLCTFCGCEELTGLGRQDFSNMSVRDMTRGQSLQKYANQGLPFNVQCQTAFIYIFFSPSSKAEDDSGSFTCSASHGGCRICIQSNYCAAATDIDLQSSQVQMTTQQT